MINSKLPLLDLHRHLDGNVRLETIIDLANIHKIKLPGTDIESLRPYVQVGDVEPNLVAWLEKLNWMTAVLGDYEACKRIARENVEDAASEGIDYVELRFSPCFMAGPHRLDPAKVSEAVIEGVIEGQKSAGIKVNLIGILSRTFGPEACSLELEALLEHKKELVAIDLAGDELAWPAKHFKQHFERAQNQGLNITVHAGEAGNSKSVWDAIHTLGANRIGHGIRSIDDPELMDYLLDKQIGLEMNITSNVQTNSVPSFSAHPIGAFLDQGLLATINTDDPVISGIDLAHEYTIAAPAAGLDDKQIQQAQLNAIKIAFISEKEKQALIDLKKAG